MKSYVFKKIMKPRLLGLTLLLLLPCCLDERRIWAQVRVIESTNTEVTRSNNPFSPSNARTEGGGLIPSDRFFPAERCASCHQDTHKQWSESLHRNAGREPFYKESVDILQRTRGAEATQHCESCHSPVAVLSGALLKGGKDLRDQDEGVSCVVCHSITEARLDGTGSYTIRRPALLVHQDGTPVFGDLPDEAILADIAGHRRAMMRPLLKTAEFCAVCHKSVAPPDLNGYKFVRGFSTYDEWQQSGASGEAVAPFYRRERQIDCRACHMSKVESTNDVAAKDGMIASHRWLGANTAAPLFYGQSEQVSLTEDFLKSKVLKIDIFAVRNETTGEILAPLSPVSENHIAFHPGQELTVDVVVANRKAAHSFPPELRDMYEPWVEFEAIDASGQTFFHSGFIKPDKMLDESAHVYKSILLDQHSRTITRHQVWLARVKAYDNTIPSGRSDIARFRFRVPDASGCGTSSDLTIRARVNYRRFIQDYTDYVLQKQKAKSLEIPVVCMATAEVRIASPWRLAVSKQKDQLPLDASNARQQAQRWNDYGIGLLEQAQYAAAAEAFRHASELDQTDPDPLISAAIAELKTERYGPERDQLRKAAALIDAALAINPNLPRARFYYALVLRAEGKPREAYLELERLAQAYPRDREVQRQLGQTLYALGRVAEARTAFEALKTIDPNDAGAYQFLSTIYASEGLTAASGQAHSLYLLWRDDPLTDLIAGRFFAANPSWAEERVAAHIHSIEAAPRPTLAGILAAPDK